MLFKATTKRTFFIAISIYFSGLAVFLYHQYHHYYQDQLEKIDLQLRLGVAAARMEISEKSKFDFSGKTDISLAEDFALAEKLTTLAKSNDLDFIYSVILDKKNIYFTSSSQTKEEVLDNGIYQSAFLTLYENPSSRLHDVFINGQAVFDEYTDQWGSFRSFFQPVYDGDKVSYVLAADIGLDKVKASSEKTLYTSLALGIFLSLIAFPLIWLFLRSIQKEHDAEKLIFFTDAGTGLKNFTKLQEDISRPEGLKLMLIEIENYNDVLNAIGPAKTALVIQQVINRLRLLIEHSSYDIELYHVNDRKLALLSDMQLSKNLNRFVQEIYQSLIKKGYGIQANNDIHLSIRLGAAANNDYLFLLANMALDDARKTNQPIVFFSQTKDLPRHYADNIKQSKIFHEALANNHVKAFFQPIIDTKTSQIAKFECLARVVDQDNHVIQMPDEFLPLTYGSRLGHKITRLMLQQSIEVAVKFQRRVSINLAVSDLFDERTIDFILRSIDERKVAHLIEFEILEHESIRDYKKAAKIIMQLKSFGCRVGMDDLGKHHSNFDRLIKLPLDFVKIDGGIIPYIENDQSALKLTKKIVEMAKEQKLEVIAEYCTNENVFCTASKLGIDYLQGYFIGRPHPDVQHIIDDYEQRQPGLLALC